VTFSYSQIAHYVRCPRSYRHHYLDGWREKDTRAAMPFGRCFEQALESLFKGEDCGATFFREWSAYREAPLEFKIGETWDRMFHQGVRLLERFARDNRIQVPDPEHNLQIKVVRDLANENQFLAYVDAIGEIDGVRCVIDWKTTSARYAEAPQGLLSLDPQLIAYSWATGISEVAFAVFVRKNQPEIQYLRASITEQQRQEYGRLVATTIAQIETAQFPSHSGIRYPQKVCLTCINLALCLGDRKLIDAHLIRTPGANDLAWLDQLVD